MNRGLLQGSLERGRCDRGQEYKRCCDAAEIGGDDAGDGDEEEEAE